MTKRYSNPGLHRYYYYYYYNVNSELCHVHGLLHVPPCSLKTAIESRGVITSVNSESGDPLVFCPLPATSCERNASTGGQPDRMGHGTEAARHGPALPRWGASQSGLISSGRASFLSCQIGTRAPALQSLDEMKSQIRAQHRVCTEKRSLCLLGISPLDYPLTMCALGVCCTPV